MHAAAAAYTTHLGRDGNFIVVVLVDNVGELSRDLSRTFEIQDNIKPRSTSRWYHLALRLTPVQRRIGMGVNAHEDTALGVVAHRKRLCTILLRMGLGFRV